MSVELVAVFDQCIERSRLKFDRERSAQLYRDELVALKAELEKRIEKPTHSLGIDLAQLGAVVLGALTVVAQLSLQIKKEQTQISPMQPNLYRLVDLWGEGVALKSQLAGLIELVAGEPTRQKEYLAACAESVLVGARELLLNAWRDASNLAGFERYGELVASALEGVSERQWGKLNQAVKRHLSALAL